MNCAECGRPIIEPGRKRYCSEGCADVAAHRKRLERLAKGKTYAKRTYRIYDYRRPEPPHE